MRRYDFAHDRRSQKVRVNITLERRDLEMLEASNTTNVSRLVRRLLRNHLRPEVLNNAS